MAQNYTVDPVDYLLKIAQRIDKKVEEIDANHDGGLTTEGVTDILDGEKESIEKHGMECYKLLESFQDYDGTPEEMVRDSDMTRTEFFQYATLLDEEGLIDLDNGSAEITPKGGQVLEGIQYVTQ